MSFNDVSFVPPPASEPRRLVLHLAQNVSAARHAAGLTQRELADAAELSRATVHLIEAGACDPRVSTIAHLARALRLSPLQLLEGRNGSS
ncbi:MAG: helix-turn-helix transcriptional regulator [Tepidisphaeraceae bacterium]